MAYTPPTLRARIDGQRDSGDMDMIDLGLFDLGSQGRIAISRGVEYQDGVFIPLTSDVQLLLRNRTSGLNPRRPDIAIFHGDRMGNMHMWFQLTHSASTTDLWHGYIRRRRRVWERGVGPKMDVSARGLLALVQNQVVTIDSAIANADVDAGIQAVLDACENVDAGDYALTDSGQALDLYFADQQPAGQVLMNMLICEMGGMLYEAKDGKITFLPRSSLLGYTLADSTKDTWGAATAIQPIAVEELEDDDELLTNVTVNTTSYTVANAENLTVYNAGYAPGGETRYFALSEYLGPVPLFPNQQGVVAIASDADLYCEPYLDYRANSAIDGSGTDLTASVTVTLFQDGHQWKYWINNNNTQSSDFYLTFFQIRASKAYLSNGGQIAGLVGNTSGTGSNDATIGTVAWMNPTNVASSNDVYATTTPGTGNTSNYLIVKLPVQDISSNAIITGISFTIEAKRASSTGAQVVNTAIVKAGTIITGTTRTFPIDATETIYMVGGPGDLWDTAWLPSDVADADFGVAIWIPAAVGNDAHSIDHVTATVHFIEFVPYMAQNTPYERRLPLPDGTKGGKGVTLTLPYIDQRDIAWDWAEQVLRVGRYGAGIIRQIYQHNDDAVIQAMLAVEPGRLIRYTSPTAASWDGDAFDDYFRVLNVQHEFAVGALGRTTVTLMPAYNFRNLDSIAWDDFMRPNDTSLGSTPTGTAWTAVSYEIASHKARSTAGSGSNAIAQFALTSADQVVEARLENTATMTSGHEAGIIARYSNSSNYWALVLQSSGSGVVQPILRKVVGGSTTTVETGFFQNAGSYEDLRLIVRGNFVSAWATGRLIYHGEDASLNSNLRVGMLIKANTTPQVANFYAQALS